MKLKTRAIGAKVAAVTAIAVGSLATLGVPAASANGTSAGNATIINPSTNQPLNAGGSQTLWSIKLPPQAHCTKDTAANSYHVSGYMVPASVDPSTLSFTSSGPTDPTNNALDYPLVDQFGSSYVFANTAPTTGQVIQIPTFNYNSWSIDGTVTGTAPLPAGVYNVGIGCSTSAATNNGDVFWNVQVTFTASGTDPNKETWTAANPQPAVPETSVGILLPLSALLMLGLGSGVIVMRNRRRTDDQAVAV
jgi:hypothetical protein